MSEAKRHRQSTKQSDAKLTKGFRPIGPAAVAAAAAQIKHQPKRPERPREVPPILRQPHED